MIELIKPSLNDIQEMQELVVDEIKKGIILERKDDEVATNIRSYIVAKENEKIIGYIALHIHTQRVAEIRSLIVAKEHRSKKIGEKMIKEALKEAKKIGIKEDVLVLTYLPDFFKKLGFIEIEKEKIPEHKIWLDCIKCKYFPICNEIALVYKIND